MNTQPENRLQNIQTILSDTSRISSHQEEIRKLKGESFNLFSILGVESRENATHSAFLGELLNPKGSHLFGTKFLELFLEAIDFEKIEGKEFDFSTALLLFEKHVGTRDDDLKTGGRIDLYLKDRKGNTLSIENKIYAGDQYAQIERYVNHNSTKNTVFYLTLNGDDASEQSSGDMKEGEHYHCISYKSTVIEWLEACMKEATQHPIVRESIRQYILLIKKLTNQLTDSTMENEIQALIAKNYSAAKMIEGSLWKVELNATMRFLDEVKTALELELKEGWKVEVSEDLNSAWSGIYIRHSSWDTAKVKLEGASKVPWSDSIYGIHASNKEVNRQQLKNKCSGIEFLQDGFKESTSWPYYKTILWLNQADNRAKLFDEAERRHLVEVVGGKLLALAKACEIPLADINKA